MAGVSLGWFHYIIPSVPKAFPEAFCEGNFRGKMKRSDACGPLLRKREVRDSRLECAVIRAQAPGWLASKSNWQPLLVNVL